MLGIKKLAMLTETIARRASATTEVRVKKRDWIKAFIK
jgi:hypothetical protein